MTGLLSNFLLWLYQVLNRTGILNYDFTHSLFIFGYFTYKKYLEDPFVKFTKHYPQFFKDGDILDIGANIGYTAYVFSKVLSPSYTVYAFEPEERNLCFLRKAAEIYHFLNSTQIIGAAVGEREGQIEIWRNDAHHADHRVMTHELRKKIKNTEQIQKTKLMTIDHFLKNQNKSYPVAFIKIDVQGYELAVCEGMVETLSKNPGCVIAFEYCPDAMAALGYQAENLIQFFKDRNYSFYYLNKKGLLEILDVNSDFRLKQKNNFRGYFDIVVKKRDLC